jgi:hypothetical protein
MTKDEFLALAGSRYDDLQRLNTEQTHFYDYEKGFAELWTERGRAVLEGNLGELPESPRKKSIANAVSGALHERMTLRSRPRPTVFSSAPPGKT